MVQIVRCKLHWSLLTVCSRGCWDYKIWQPSSTVFCGSYAEQFSFVFFQTKVIERWILCRKPNWDRKLLKWRALWPRILGYKKCMYCVDIFQLNRVFLAHNITHCIKNCNTTQVIVRAPAIRPLQISHWWYILKMCYYLQW